jgi:hypothetical protein
LTATDAPTSGALVALSVTVPAMAPLSRTSGSITGWRQATNARAPSRSTTTSNPDRNNISVIAVTTATSLALIVTRFPAGSTAREYVIRNPA